jgi:UrcA family protein
MSKFIASLAAAAIALTATPMVAFAKPAAAVRLDIASVDFNNREQVAAFSARIGAVQAQMCKSVPDKVSCRNSVMSQIKAQLKDEQRAALDGVSASETANAR